jgi:hypothetical protein
MVRSLDQTLAEELLAKGRAQQEISDFSWRRRKTVVSLRIAPSPHEKTPASLRQRGFRFHQIKSLAVTYFHIDKVDTSIGAERFHFRVRKGIGWFPLAMAARQTGCKGAESWLSPFTNSTICFDV